MPFTDPIMNPSIMFIFLYDEILPSNKNKSKLVNNLMAKMDIKNIITSEKIIIMLALTDIY